MSQDAINQLKSLQLGNPPSEDAGIFGASLKYGDAQLVIIPVPYEATTSYGSGSSLAPEAIRRASHQMDLVDGVFGKPYLAGITYLDGGELFLNFNREAKDIAQNVIHDWETNGTPKQDDLNRVNNVGDAVNGLVYKRSQKILNEGKTPAVLGGDHSVPLGLIRALSEKYNDFGILHIDAHHDLRKAYEGFDYSHASIIYNVHEQIPQVSKILSVGIRDYSAEEEQRASESSRINTIYDQELRNRKLRGESFYSIVSSYIKNLPQKVYISFDIDGLDPALCPNTGTPVPGGLSYSEACFLVEMLVEGGKEVIGFDLSEVSPGGGEWDSNVGARILYKLCGSVVKSRNLPSLIGG